MIYDLKTGEAYGHVIYADGATVVLWTDGRESVIRPVDLVAPVELIAWGAPVAVVARFQDDPLAIDDLPPAAAARRDALAEYAGRNGGQIAEHREPPPEPPKGVVAGLARLFAPR